MFPALSLAKRSRRPLDEREAPRKRTAKLHKLLQSNERCSKVQLSVIFDSFVPREQMDERYLDSHYYLVPNDSVGQEAFAVIRDAMLGKNMVALGRIVLAKRERVVMLQPWDKGLRHHAPLSL
jgi:non-homologous end joining protein Ku